MAKMMNIRPFNLIIHNISVKQVRKSLLETVCDSLEDENDAKGIFWIVNHNRNFIDCQPVNKSFPSNGKIFSQ